MSTTPYHVLMPYEIRDLSGRPTGNGVLDQVFDLTPDYTRSRLYQEVIQLMRDRHPGQILNPLSFHVGRNDLSDI